MMPPVRGVISGRVSMILKEIFSNCSKVLNQMKIDSGMPILSRSIILKIKRLSSLPTVKTRGGTNAPLSVKTITRR